MNKLICSICKCEFDIEREGGVTGNLGPLPVSFCPTCHSSLYDFFSDGQITDVNTTVDISNETSTIKESGGPRP